MVGEDTFITELMFFGLVVDRNIVDVVVESGPLQYVHK